MMSSSVSPVKKKNGGKQGPKIQAGNYISKMAAKPKPNAFQQQKQVVKPPLFEKTPKDSAVMGRKKSNMLNKQEDVFLAAMLGAGGQEDEKQSIYKPRRLSVSKSKSNSAANTPNKGGNKNMSKLAAPKNSLSTMFSSNLQEEDQLSVNTKGNKSNVEKYKEIMMMKQNKTASKDDEIKNKTGTSSSSALSLISASVGPNALSQRPRVLSLRHSEYVLICPNKHLTIAAAKLKTKEDSEIENINQQLATLRHQIGDLTYCTCGAATAEKSMCRPCLKLHQDKIEKLEAQRRTWYSRRNRAVALTKK
ncbi:unnamed protein product [Amoebophrya sp. A120]|nr:unnamed protein product [Amoebophrya sp. A120]|eukprot:GSA120T00015520001.1